MSKTSSGIGFYFAIVAWMVWFRLLLFTVATCMKHRQAPPELTTMMPIHKFHRSLCKALGSSIPQLLYYHHQLDCYDHPSPYSLSPAGEMEDEPLSQYHPSHLSVNVTDKMESLIQDPVTLDYPSQLFSNVSGLMESLLGFLLSTEGFIFFLFIMQIFIVRFLIRMEVLAAEQQRQECGPVNAIMTESGREPERDIPVFPQIMSWIDKAHLESRFTDLKIEVDYRDGKYFTSLDKIWDQEEVSFTGAVEEYQKRKHHTEEVQRIYDHLDGESWEELWLDYEALAEYLRGRPMFPGMKGQVSLFHSLPDSKVYSMNWGEPASLLLGRDIKNCFDDAQMRSLVQGLRVNIWNCLPLPDAHGPHYDALEKKKGSIVAPIWNRSKKWSKGTPYKVLVAATPESYKWLMGKDRMEEDEPQLQWLGIASTEEYKCATDFLGSLSKTHADLLFNSSVVSKVIAFTEENKEKWARNNLLSQNKQLKGLRSLLEKDYSHTFHLIEGSSREETSDDRSLSTKSTITSEQKLSIDKVDELIKSLITLANSKTKLEREGKMSVPVIKPGLADKRRLLTVDFGKYYEKHPELIPPPDWLGFKAVMTWSTIALVPLLSGYNNGSDDTSCDDECVVSQHSASESIAGDVGIDLSFSDELDNELDDGQKLVDKVPSEWQ